MYFILLWLQPHYSAWERTLRFFCVTAHSEGESICVILHLCSWSRVEGSFWKAAGSYKTSVLLPCWLDVSPMPSQGAHNLRGAEQNCQTVTRQPSTSLPTGWQGLNQLWPKAAWMWPGTAVSC